MGDNVITRVFISRRRRQDSQHPMGLEKDSTGDVALEMEGARSQGMQEGSWDSPWLMD